MPVLIWPVLAILIAILGWSSLNAELKDEERAVNERALSAAAAIARGYADQIARTVQVVDQILLHVRYEWILSNGTLRLENTQQTDLFPASSIFNIGILSREGYLLTNTVPPRETVNAADRRYFFVHREAGGDALYIGETVTGRVSKRRVVQFSRRITDADGSFNGVVRASVAPEYLMSTYDAVTLGTKGFMAVVGNDLAIRATRIGDTVSDTEDSALKAGALSSEQARETVLMNPSGSVLAAGQTWFSDNRNRYIGWQQVSGYPVIAMVGLDAEDVLAAHVAEREEVFNRALLSSAVLAAFTVVAMGLSLRLAWRKREMDVARAAYRLATEEGSEGFFICRPVAAKEGDVVDFEIIDCNQTGAEFYGKRPADMLGARLTSLHSHDDDDWRDRLMARMQCAMERSPVEDDLELRQKGKRERKWLRLKIVSSEGVLAVTLEDITKNKEHLIELERRGNEDTLTGLPNRHWLTTYLPSALQRAADQQSKLALLFVDLDGFKAVNDTAGHGAGDELLRNVARRIIQAVRPDDRVVRIGGDEFIVIVEQLADRESAAHIADRIVQAFHGKFRLAAGTFAIGTSIGISSFPDDGTDGDSLLTHADAAMYSVKTGGKHGYRFFDHAYYAAMRERQQREDELRRALEQDELILYYQPRVDVSTGVTCSMEALVRWSHPTRGIVNPLEFIPLAEETGQIVRLGELVINKVCAQLATWQSIRHELVPVSINVSAIQFNEAQIASILREALQRHGVAASLVEIELTESSMTGDSQHVTRALEDLQRLGVALAVDDFGTGYSSLSQLQRLDFDVLKVDRAFTADLVRTPEGEIFFTAIITMAHALGMRVVAEGVETLEQVRKLKALRCDEIQGYYVSRPLPAVADQPILPRCLFI